MFSTAEPSSAGSFAIKQIRRKLEPFRNRGRLSYFFCELCYDVRRPWGSFTCMAHDRPTSGVSQKPSRGRCSQKILHSTRRHETDRSAPRRYSNGTSMSIESLFESHYNKPSSSMTSMMNNNRITLHQAAFLHVLAYNKTPNASLHPMEPSDTCDSAVFANPPKRSPFADSPTSRTRQEPTLSHRPLVLRARVFSDSRSS